MKDGLYIDTQFEELTGTWQDGTPYYSSWRNSELEREFYEEHHPYAKNDILEIVNRYKVGKKFTDICLIEATAKDIIKNLGGFRELDILGEGKDFHTEGTSYFKIGAWNDDHKIVYCVKQVWEECAPVWVAGTLRKSRKLVDTICCEVDLITGKITG